MARSAGRRKGPASGAALLAGGNEGGVDWRFEWGRNRSLGTGLRCEDAEYRKFEREENALRWYSHT